MIFCEIDPWWSSQLTDSDVGDGESGASVVVADASVSSFKSLRSNFFLCAATNANSFSSDLSPSFISLHSALLCFKSRMSFFFRFRIASGDSPEFS
jgi:hypothetical protein